jgi:broad specificity phosphatase PhoE
MARPTRPSPFTVASRPRASRAAFTIAFGLRPSTQATCSARTIRRSPSPRHTTWEGRTYRELWDKEDLWGKMKRDPDFAPHGGESPRQVTDRLVATLRRLALSHFGERIVCVSHGGAMSMALGHILEGDYSEWTRLLDNCAVAELVFEPEPALLSFNESWS